MEARSVSGVTPIRPRLYPMNNIFRGLLAGYGAKKLGGGCFSTILVFILLWVLLGQCNAALPPLSPESNVHKMQSSQVERAKETYVVSGIPPASSPIAFGIAIR